MANVGTITAIWRYPVKLMIGKELDDSAVTEQGLLGDRARRRHTTATLDRLGELYPPLMVTLPAGDVSKDPGILRTGAQHNGVGNPGLRTASVRRRPHHGGGWRELRPPGSGGAEAKYGLLP
jgi:hypothetical protein